MLFVFSETFLLKSTAAFPNEAIQNKSFQSRNYMETNHFFLFASAKVGIKKDPHNK